MADTDRVQVASAITSGQIIGGSAEIRSVVIETSGTAGTLSLHDNTCSGAALITIHTPAAATIFDVKIPGYVRFVTDVCATLTNVNGVTIFYKGG